MPNADQRAMLGRRALLAAVLTGSVAGLAGCGIRMEGDAPHIPGIQKQGPPPDQATLRVLVTSIDTAISAAGHSAWETTLAGVHRAQRTRLLAVMATQGMTPAATTAQPTGPAVDPGAMFRFEQAGARAIGSLMTLSARNLPMAAAIAVTQNAGAALLGHRVAVNGGVVPKPAVVQAILPSLRAAIYAFEVIIAKTPLKARKRAEATLTGLHAVRATWEASLGKDLPTSPDGFTLPVQPTTNARRQQLAQLVLTDLVDACAGQVTATRSDRGGFIGLTTLWADSTAQLWQWGAKPTPFPGLQ
ncbi:DUF4439 domain-containing protein [Flexivirga alba]|uniref:DUF4439 domain-containing protein n=1 Tax=Flexivirga alba TaxID=702742 RepID=A0ABW2AL95_9MICO